MGFGNTKLASLSRTCDNHRRVESNPYQPPSATLGADHQPSTGPVAPGVLESFAHVRPWMNVLAMALAGCGVVVLAAAVGLLKFRSLTIPLLLTSAVFSGFLMVAARFVHLHARDIARLLADKSGASLDATVVSLGEVWRLLGVMVLTAIALVFGLRYALQMFLST